MADLANKAILSQKSTPNETDAWKPIGHLAAALVLAAIKRAGAK